MKVTQYCKLSDSVARQTRERGAESEFWVTNENSCLFVCLFPVIPFQYHTEATKRSWINILKSMVFKYFS